MDENCDMETVAGVSDEDIIHLLNTKQKISREILSITNAAADAVSSRAQTGAQPAFGEYYSSQNYAENKENNMDAHISGSFVSTTSLDRSFSGQQRVRIPSRLLREIKSPMDRSSSGNASSSESKSNSSGDLFASQSSSEHSSVQATGPVPTVIKYSSQPLEQPQSNSTHSKKNRLNDTPVVIKYLQEYASDSNDSTINSSKTTKSQVQLQPQTKDVFSINSSTQSGVSVQGAVKAANNSTAMPATITQKSTKASVERHGQNKQDAVVSEGKNVSVEQQFSQNSHAEKVPEAKCQSTGEQGKMKGAGLPQGAPSSNLSYVHGESERGRVKAVPFNSSDKGKATRDMLAKRQEHGLAVRRIIQPKIINEKPVKEEQRLLKTAENVGKGRTCEDHGGTSTSRTTVQLPSGFEEQMKNLVSSLGAIESQCQENRAWQERQQQELELSIKQRDERRLQHLEEMQKQLVEYQLKYAQPITALPHQTYTSTVGNSTLGLSTTQLNHAAPTHRAMPQHSLQASSGQFAGQTLTQAVSGENPNYTPAVQHQAQPSFKTAVYGKPREENLKSGVKRKFVRNTRTQTSPQVSSCSSETSSPLDTPLPRKRHPVPMTRDWKADRGKKHVHFDTPHGKNTGKSLKNKVNDRSVVGRLHVDDQNINKAQSLQSSHEQYERQRPLVPQRSPEADYVVNDISRLRKELRDALNETEQTKKSLKNLDDRIHSQISSSDESVVALPDHSRSYPLDAYLRATRDVPEELSTPRMEEDSKTDQKGKITEEKPSLCAHALSVLHDVQKQKDNLEWNLLALSRRHDEQYLYDLVENDEATTEALRIRKDVAKKIDEIDAVVQAELLHEEQQRALENQVSVERSKPAKRPTPGVPVSTEKRAKLRNAGKENTQSRTKTTAKPKVSKVPTKPAPKQPTVKRPLEDVTYTSRVYGRPGHVARRTTTKPDQARHQSSSAVKPSKTAPRRRTTTSPQRLDESGSTTLSEDYRPSTRRVTKPRYYFHPNAGTDQSVIDAHFKDNPGPLPGQLLPMAIPLGKPRKDPALRLPLCIDEGSSRHPQTVSVISDVRQPNVAVITLKDEDCLQDSDSEMKKRKKSVSKRKEHVHLERQILPNVDIDTSAVSELSSDVSPNAIVDEPTILPIPDPLPRPDASEYEEFKDYEHVGTVGDDQGSEKSSIHGGESVISLHGESRTDQPSYQGPAFPPRNVQMDEPGGFQGSVDDLRTPSETVELKARELIEQELLARVVSEMAPPPPDPTSRVRRSPSSQSLAESSDTEPDLAAAIGLRGLQLFVDAGIPVDTELVRNLITEVLQEKVATMLGYPKPQKRITPPAQEPEDDYTEPESGSEDYSRVQTPIRTPSAASQLESRPLSHVSTPEQTEIPDSISSSTPEDDIGKNVVTSGHVVPDKLSEEIEEGPLDDSVLKSPMATPVATPSPPHSVTSLRTPEVSEQEKVKSEEKSLVETPEITESTQDKTPTESLKELEDDLKEQTLVEDDAGDEDQGTEADIPVIKFDLEPGPSEAKVTNSPSSVTTTTYSTRSTMGTVATDDEISEGEQLQPYVHVGQFSEGEFVAPSGITGNMTTLHEIPDDIFDSFGTSNKQPDLVRQAVHGLLKLDDVSDESTQASEEHTNSEGERRLPRGGLLAQSVLQDERSEGEVAGDVVSSLLSRIRQSVWRGRRSRADNDATSIGEVGERDPQTFPQGHSAGDEEDQDLSFGELPAQDRNVAKMEALPMQTLDNPSLLDSDENNNDSQRSSSISEVPNQTWDTNIIMVTPKKASVPFNQEKPHPGTSYSEQSSPANLELHTTLPRVVHVAEARHVSTPTAFSPTPGREMGSNDNVTMETLSEIDIGSRDIHLSDHGTDYVSDMSDHLTPKQVPPDHQARIQLTLPSAEPSASVSLISEGVLGSEDSAGEISSISSGEI